MTFFFSLERLFVLTSIPLTIGTSSQEHFQDCGFALATPLGHTGVEGARRLAGVCFRSEASYVGLTSLPVKGGNPNAKQDYKIAMEPKACSFSTLDSRPILIEHTEIAEILANHFFPHGVSCVAHYHVGTRLFRLLVLGNASDLQTTTCSVIYRIHPRTIMNPCPTAVAIRPCEQA